MNNASTSKTESVPTGIWGGRGIRMQISDSGASLEYDCAHGSIDELIATDSTNRFDVKGVLVRERGGPVREGEDSEGEPARYTGHIDGKTMTLTVTLTRTNETVGTFTLSRGKAPRLVKCL